MSTDTGGPAFPRPASVAPRMADIKPQDGMSLRDYFAAKAMQSLILCAKTSNDIDLLAKSAYAMADAMLKEGK